MDVRHYRTDLFPEIEPYASGRLPLDGRTRCTGSSRVIRAASPSCSCTAARAPVRRRRIAGSSIPTAYRIVIFDQRGCGRSTPHGEIADNSTSPPGRRHGGAAPPPRHRPLAPVRRVVGHRPWRSPTASAHPDRLRRLRAARHLSRHPPRGRLVPLRHAARSFRRPGGRSPSSCRRTSAAICSTGYHRRLIDRRPGGPSCRRRAAWSRYETVCSSLIPRRDDPLRRSATTAPPWRSPASRRTISSTTSSSRTTS